LSADYTGVLAVTTTELGRIQVIFYNFQAQGNVLKSKLSFLLGGRQVDVIDSSFKKRIQANPTFYDSS